MRSLSSFQTVAENNERQDNVRVCVCIEPSVKQSIEDNRPPPIQACTACHVRVASSQDQHCVAYCSVLDGYPRSENNAQQKHRKHFRRFKELNKSARTPNDHTQNKLFQFDRVFDQHADQDEVFASICQPLLKQIYIGNDASIILYGQPSCDKACSFFGPDQQKGERRGVLLRSVDEIVQFLDCQNFEYSVNLAVFQVYLDNVVIDLLGKKNCSLPMCTNGSSAAAELPDLSWHPVSDSSGVAKLIEKSKERIVFSENLKGIRTPRAHICTIVDVLGPTMEATTAKSRRFLIVDLAASESVTSIPGYKGLTQDEQKSINSSLHAIQRVFRSLAQKRVSRLLCSDDTFEGDESRQRGGGEVSWDRGIEKPSTLGEKKKSALQDSGNQFASSNNKNQDHIPWRESAITRIMRRYLEPEAAYWVLVVSVSASHRDLRPSLQSLQFAESAMPATWNEVPESCFFDGVPASITEMEIQRIQAENSQLTELNQDLMMQLVEQVEENMQLRKLVQSTNIGNGTSVKSPSGLENAGTNISKFHPGFEKYVEVKSNSCDDQEHHLRRGLDAELNNHKSLNQEGDDIHKGKASPSGSGREYNVDNRRVREGNDVGRLEEIPKYVPYFPSRQGWSLDPVITLYQRTIVELEQQLHRARNKNKFLSAQQTTRVEEPARNGDQLMMAVRSTKESIARVLHTIRQPTVNNG